MPGVIENARADPANAGIGFFASNAENIRSHGPYDIITALSVFCVFPKSRTLDNLSDSFPFARFNQSLNIITSSLAPAAILGLFNCNYFFEDTDAFPNYTPLSVDRHPHSGFCDRFERKGKKAARFIIHQDGERVPPGRHDKTREAFYSLRFKRSVSRPLFLRTCLWLHQPPLPQANPTPAPSPDLDVLISHHIPRAQKQNPPQ